MASVRKLAAWLSGRPGVILILLVCWVAVTAAGAGRAAEAEAWIGVPSLDWVLNVLFFFMTLGGLLILIAAVTSRRRELPERVERKPMWPLILLFLAVAALTRWGVPFGNDEESTVVETTAAEDTGDEPGRAAPLFDRLDAGAILLLLGIAGGVLIVTRRLSDRGGFSDDEDEDSLAAALPSAVDRAAEELLAGEDPRSAILLAYHGLEATLEDQGEPRRETETPTEHLRRVLAAFPIDTGPLLRLARLYELARFSDQVLTDGDRRDAAASLRRVRQQLAARS